MRRRILALGLLATSCGTLASPAGGDRDLPNANAGPFRLLKQSELDSNVDGYSAPFIAKSERHRYRSPSPLDIDEDPSTLPIWLYAVSGEDYESRIVRFFAHDGRSLERAPEVVLEASEPWEGGRVFSPSALRVGGEIWLYYVGAEGVGLAKSKDGRAFVKEEGPIRKDALGCGGTGVIPNDISVIRLPTGGFRMFFSIGEGICEAISSDGIEFHPTRDRLVLRTSDEPDDFDFVSAPFAWATTSPEGRLVVRVYYTGESAEGATSIGMAARFGEDGPLHRALSPVLRAESPDDAAVLPFEGFTLLYFTAQSGSKDAPPALAAAVAPADIALEARR